MERVNKTALLFGFALAVTPLVLWFVYDKNRDIKKNNSTNVKPVENNEIDVNTNLKDGIKCRILVLYGTTTGYARTYAHKLAHKIKTVADGNNKNTSNKSDINISIVDMSEFDSELLDRFDLVFAICSTWTDGKPPVTAQRFVDGLKDLAYDFRVSKNMLSKLEFSIFGLGSLTYGENFCKPAKEIAECLEVLGSTPCTMDSRVLCGDDQTDLDDQFHLWTYNIIEYLKNKNIVSMNSSFENNFNSFQKHNKRVINNDNNSNKNEKIIQLKINHHHHNNINNNNINNNNNLVVIDDPTAGLLSDDDEMEQEDIINNHYVTMDQEDASCDSDDENHNHNISLNQTVNTSYNLNDSVNKNDISGELLDLEELGSKMNQAQKSIMKEALKASANGVRREMVTNLQRKALTKEGYRIIGSHSAVKLCRWTKNQMRGRGGCYKHTFYGITSYQCMEATPSLACANKCVFCWRHHKNPVGTEWRWKEDEPAKIVHEAVELHRSMINEMKGVPGVQSQRLQEAHTVRHCALSLVGEPIMYPRINEMLQELHNRKISSFMVTNAQFPDKIKELDPVTQLYVSVDASTKDSLKAIDRPLFRDFWERFIQSLQEMKEKQQRTVYRMTLVKSWNMDEAEGYVELIEAGQPDFIEIKAFTYCGKSDASSLTMQNVPWHREVCEYEKRSKCFLFYCH
eukprot:gene14525-19501_t